MRGNWVQSVQLEPPSLADNTADADRLFNVLSKKLKTEHIEADLSLVGKLPGILRKNKYGVRCILLNDRNVWRLAGVTGLKEETPVVGLAVDLGTTRVVIRLVNLESRRIIDEFAFDNPQLEVGADILTRIHYTDQDGGLEYLNGLIINGLNKSIQFICGKNNVSTDHIYLAALAGNTAMTHLFLNLSPEWIIREPYIPVVNTPGVLRAKDLGLNINHHARAFVFPNVGSYFGGDLISGILYSGLARKKETAILVDVGTNAEVVLGNKNWLVACAGAAGPALEGGVAKMGMKADSGVIDRVTVNKGGTRFDIHTIDDKPPKGICGSGLIDLAAQLFQHGVIDIRGKFGNTASGHIKIKEKDGMTHLVVVPAEESATGQDLTISQADLDSLVRSKAAMYTILETISTFVGVDMRKLKDFYIAGTFGIFIRPESAVTIGMMPDLPLENYTPLGNSSLGGATMFLESSQYAGEIIRIRDQITYMELNVNQEFMNRFNAAKFFPHTDTSLFPSVKIYPS